jgi:peptide chain release factor 1
VSDLGPRGGDDVARLVAQIVRTREELDRELGDPGLVADRERYAAVTKRYADLGEAFRLAELHRDAAGRAEEARALLAEGDDEDVRALLREAEGELAALGPAIREAMVLPDPDDDRDTIVEIRAAAGGQEAALFARDLLDVYRRYAEARGLRLELLAASDADAGGLRDVTFAVKGAGAHGVFKHEAGVHRVQRVPATESQGRLHTSTATVAVLPEAAEVEVRIDPKDLNVDVYRSSGPGGQSVNTTDSAVRVTHLPTGIVVSMQDEKSQLQNRERAMRVLRARLYERAQAERAAAESAARRSQLGSGDRAEKVRTYNYPQNLVTDHRIGQDVPLREQVLQGALGPLTEALAAEERRRRLEEQAGGPDGGGGEAGRP